MIKSQLLPCRIALGVALAGLFGIGGCIDARNLVTIEESLLVRSLLVTTKEGEVLWRIDALRPMLVRTVYYGVIPTGFHQEIPAGSMTPRPFQLGEGLAVVIVSTTHIYRHEGNATGENGFRGGFGETAPFSANTLARALKGNRITDDVPVARTVQP